MLTICDPTDADHIGDPSVRSLLHQRLAEVLDGAPYGPEAHGAFIVLEPGDTTAALEEASGCPILTNPFDESRFPDPEFAPVSEWIEDHGACYEMFFIFSDDVTPVANNLLITFSGNATMNIRSLINRSLSTVFAVWFLAASVPAVNSQVITPFEAFVLTPLLVMLAGLGGVATCGGLDRVEIRVHRWLRQLAERRRGANSYGDAAAARS